MIFKYVCLASGILQVAGSTPSCHHEDGMSCGSLEAPATALVQLHHLPKRRSRKEQTEGQVQAPCFCEAEGSTWQTPEFRSPQCIFVDLGAADGNTFFRFLDGGFGNLERCPSYQAFLVEANPIFNEPLGKLAGAWSRSNMSGHVQALWSTAAYACDGTTNFFLDTIDWKEHFWGSSMSPNARDVQRSGKKSISVPTMNVARLLAENVLPDDYVIVKMDVEGSEWDILPCLAKSSSSNLIDALYVEKHPRELSLLNTQQSAYDRAVSDLQKKGVYVPAYDSPTF